MKKLFILFIVLLGFVFVGQSKELPFAGSTKHKTIKKMKRHQIREIQKGKTFYIRKKGVVIKNL